MHVIQGIKGFLGTSLIDFPGRVAAVIFLSGCNLRCAFCHNSRLLGNEIDLELEDLPLDELIRGLERRRKLLDGIVVTGGEPTAHPQLTYLLRNLRPLGLDIKLDTNGLKTTLLKILVKEGLVDYLAVDMKLAPERYPRILGAPEDAAERLVETVDFLRTVQGVEYEYRTTCVPGLVQEDDIRQIARLISGAPAYYLQQYIPTFVVEPDLAARPPYPAEVLERFREIARPFVQEVSLRSI